MTNEEHEISDLEARVLKTETKRQKALANQDAVRYAKYCSHLGVEPEDPILYKRGEDMLEAELHRIENFRFKYEDEARHREFLNLAAPYERLNKFAEPSKKAALLRTYFPGQFGRRGKQPLSRHTDIQICSIFENIYRDYKEKYK